MIVSIEANGEAWRGRVIAAGVDNAGLAACVNAQRARDPVSRQLMRRLAWLLAKFDIILLGFWTPRIWNHIADLLSKGMSFDRAIVRARALYATQMAQTQK